MATIQTSIILQDGASASLMSINKTISITIKTIEMMEKAMNKAAEGAKKKTEQTKVSFQGLTSVIKMAGTFVTWALGDALKQIPNDTVTKLGSSFDSIQKKVAESLYPTVIRFLEVILNNSPQIEAIMLGIAYVCNVVFSVLSVLAEAALSFASVIIDNWSWIIPLLLGVAAAMAIVWLATNGVTAAQAIGSKAMEIYGLAQTKVNAAIAACPLVWYLLILIAIIAIFYAAVAAVNHFAGTSISATGLICGAFMMALAVIGNLFIAFFNVVAGVFISIYNIVVAVANFLANVFNDPIGAIARLFFDLADIVLGVIEAIAKAIDAVFGSNLAGAVQGFRDGLGGWVDKIFGEGVEVTPKMNISDLDFGRFDEKQAFNMGYEGGEGFETELKNKFSFDRAALDWNSASTIEDTAMNAESIAGNTSAMADNMEISEEDIKFLRDVAEREVVNQFTSVPLQVTFNTKNSVNSDYDLDSMVTSLEQKLVESIYSSAEAVHV